MHERWCSVYVDNNQKCDCKNLPQATPENVADFYNGTIEDGLAVIEAAFKRLQERGVESNYGITQAAIKQIRIAAATSQQPAAKGVEGLVEALTLAGKRFRFYEQQHKAKTPPDTVKAENNSEYAAMCEEALAKFKEGG